MTVDVATIADASTTDETRQTAVIDGNEAVARVAYALSETICLYPITPASPMGEHADAWSSTAKPNVWGNTPAVSQLQSEAGAAGALHGAVQAGALATTFTASQGLLLMLPNMFKIAGELTPAVIHVAARTIATHALSIFGDHSDVMTARTTGWSMLSSTSPQEAHDLAAIAHAATLATRVPMLHFMDGFRTSHELNEVDLLSDEALAAMIDPAALQQHRQLRLDPDRPVLRGSAQNPDVFFQAREASNPYHDAVAPTVVALMDDLAALTGRRYHLVEHYGANDAEHVVVVMGSASGTLREAVDHLNANGRRVAVVTVRLYRPFPVEALLAALPDTARAVAVLDRTKEPGSVGEPLLQDVVHVLADAVTGGRIDNLPVVIGGRYGLSSKEFTPAMAMAVFDELARPSPKPRFTVGIIDDVTHLSLVVDRALTLPRPHGDLQVVLHGLGSDGTVGASKNTTKIVAAHSDLHVQAAFVYDSKKSGAVTESHLRFSKRTINSTYLVEQADIIGCHQFGLFERINLLDRLRDGGTVIVNAPFAPDQLWDRLPADVQQTLIDKHAKLYAIDAYAIAREAGIAGRINTVMQVALFDVAGLMDSDVAFDAIAGSIRATYADLGDTIVDRNLAAIAAARGAVVAIELQAVTAAHARVNPVERAAALRGMSAGDIPSFVTRVTARLTAGEGELLPVSALPADGTFPTATARFEKRTLADSLPNWDPDICIDCGKCAIVCPHAAIQIKAFDADTAAAQPDVFLSKPFKDRNLVDHHITVQVAPDDCTGCGVCVQTCPAVSRTNTGHKALDMMPAEQTRSVERQRWQAFEQIPYLDRSQVRHDTVKHSQLLQPLFEASGACAGCGETPYLKLMTQLFGDRAVVANATGCSSIYGGNLPTTPWGTNAAGRGPAWSNSLFEDNAEFGLGLRLGLDEQRASAISLARQLRAELDADLVDEVISHADGHHQHNEATIEEQRNRVDRLVTQLRELSDTSTDEHIRGAAQLLDVTASALIRRDVWIIGGDGWAYDIGFGGLDHVLASGADVNILVLDTEVYSNTGGQASKATPRGAVAKFASAGKTTAKKDLGLLAMQYGNVYVAQIALGANEMHTVKAFREAEAWPGPSLLLAYSTCIAHGVDMEQSMTRMDLAVRSGYWPLYRFLPDVDEATAPFHLDSAKPTVPVADFMRSEGRYAVLERSDPSRAEEFRQLAQADIDERWHYYEQLAGVGRRISDADPAAKELRDD
ncbi:MAG: pyruvate:ferredoxin (flavodoxin) oxidoreductase [Nitriliruptoraceae bacterium]